MSRAEHGPRRLSQKVCWTRVQDDLSHGAGGNPTPTPPPGPPTPRATRKFSPPLPGVATVVCNVPASRMCADVLDARMRPQCASCRSGTHWRGGGGGGFWTRGGEGGGGRPSSLATGLPNIFGAKGAGKIFLHKKSPYLSDPPPCQQMSQCKGNFKAINLWQNPCPQ